ncbi:hypothetical protein Bca4012_075691 [Brassica carinata]|uniref:Mediator complex subunit 15 KIX domain-containing protein n=1 Tax=Brassica carinata TaxID=52824 RepID=A0A8X7QBG3_BRACI|nr:hypothetical protein Bca52824_073907 [Brassica carinata]
MEASGGLRGLSFLGGSVCLQHIPVPFSAIYPLMPFLLNEEPAIKSGDWRTQLPQGSRQNIVNKMFEEKIFSSAVHQTDYLRKISMKILTMETKAQNAAGSDSSILADSNNLTLDEIMNHLIKDNAEPSLLNVEPAINSVDWRIQLPPDSRQKNINKLMETLKKHVPYSWQEGIEELGRIAISFEELIFNTALNQVDYFCKISLKMQTMEEDDCFLILLHSRVSHAMKPMPWLNSEFAKLTHVLASEAAQIVVEPILGSIISPCSVVGAIRVKNFNEGADVTEPALLQNVAARPDGIAAITSSVAAPSPEADGVDVIRAHILFPTDGQGTANAFVELYFDGHLMMMSNLNAFTF